MVPPLKHVATIKDTPIDQLVIKSFFFNLLNFLDILFMLWYDDLIVMIPQNRVLLSTITVGPITIPEF